MGVRDADRDFRQRTSTFKPPLTDQTIRLCQNIENRTPPPSDNVTDAASQRHDIGSSLTRRGDMLPSSAMDLNCELTFSPTSNALISWKRSVAEAEAWEFTRIRQVFNIWCVGACLPASAIDGTASHSRLHSILSTENI